MLEGTRFYKPRLAKLTGKELMFARESINKDYRRGTELDVPDFDFTAPASTHPIMTRRTGLQYNNNPDDFEPEFFNMGPFQITYNFSHGIRKNNFALKNALPFQPGITKEYGASGWSFRMLYEFLCEAYNNGMPFIDAYFDRVFKTRPVYAEFTAVYETIQDDINNEQFDLFSRLPLKADGTPDMRFAVSKRYMDFKVWQDPIIRQDCKMLAKAIRADIEVCLSTGRLPLRGKEGARVSSRTRKLRGKLGGMIHADRLFYASGQLIRHLNIYVEIGGKGAQTA
jgi:hypothetical protein